MTNERARLVVEDLEKTLLRFVQKHKVNHDEYRLAIETVISSVKAGEESLLYDVFLEAATTNNSNVGKHGSLDAIEGPFYLPNAPKLEPPYVLPQRPDEAGDVLFFRGLIASPDGQPVAEAEIDMWQADAAGLYSNVHPNIPAWNLRGRLQSRDDGTFEVKTILPPPYEIPKHGPTGAVLKVLGRHCFRPAHLHMKISHPQYCPLTSQLYFDGGEYLDSDVANAVRSDLIVKLIGQEDSSGIAARGLCEPYFEADFDFVLVPRTERI
jgi:catechol 1,2-dioxygenase